MTREAFIGVRHLLAFTAACLALTGTARADVDWSAALLRDAQALHDTYLESHPGPVDAENPAFKAVLAAGLSQARARAPNVNSYGGYWWALREYAAAFDDAHVFLERTESAPKTSAAWPGFLTRETDAGQVVAVRGGPSSAPPLGALLVSCHGVAARTLLEQHVGRFRGLWALESQRQAHAWRLFLDAENPFVPRPSRCLFQEGGGQREYALEWIPLPDDAFEKLALQVSSNYQAPIDVRPFGPGGLWISLGSFTADGSTEAGRQLEAAAKRLESNAAEIASAKLIVLDVRGNTGGSSAWGKRLAAAIWGPKNADAAAPRSEGVDWRASAGNIAGLKALKEQPGSGFRLRLWAGHIIRGMQRARASGQPLWRESPLFGGLRGTTRARAGTVNRAAFIARGPVYVLTDGACVSACLDALDVWKALGAVQVGRETSADSLYMEIRRQTLPTGLTRVSVPMKVYRGRPRAGNQPHRPARPLVSDMRDMPAIEAELAALASSRAATQ